MIYDAVERAHTILTANFATDMAALLTAKSLTGYNSTVAVVKRRSAEHEAATPTNNLATTPRIGVWSEAAVTQAKMQTERRDSIVMVTMEYVARGTDEDIIAVQVEIAAEAIMMSVDKMSGDASVIGAGEETGETTVELRRTSHATGQQYAQDVVRVIAPIVDRDTGL